MHYWRHMPRFLQIALLSALVFSAGPAMAANYPSRPIRLVVGFPPGGGGDLYGRLLAQGLSKRLNNPVIVENKPGAGGNIAAEAVARSAPDGYTLLLAMSGNVAVAPVVRGAKLPYKSPGDFAMIGMAVEAPYGLFVAAKSPLKSGKQFFDDTKHKEITVGSTSPSSAAHMVMEMVKFKSKAKMLYVPYSGSGPAVTDLIGGQIEGFFVTAPPLVGQVKGGILRLLAITGDKRSPVIPDVPTFKELGVPVNVTQWYGLVAPKGTPAEILDKLSRTLSEVLKEPKVRKVIQQDGAAVADIPRQRFAAYVDNDIAGYRNDIDPGILASLAH